MILLLVHNLNFYIRLFIKLRRKMKRSQIKRSYLFYNFHIYEIISSNFNFVTALDDSSDDCYVINTITNLLKF